MLAKIKTVFKCTEKQFWNEVLKPDSLQYVASPIIRFVSAQHEAFNGQWKAGQNYPLKLYLFNFIPLGRHSIKIIKIDRDENLISSQEKGQIAGIWNHHIIFQEESPGNLRYEDVIEIRAGLLTPIIWVFAHVFYRHRQRRWKILIREINI